MPNESKPQAQQSQATEGQAPAQAAERPPEAQAGAQAQDRVHVTSLPHGPDQRAAIEKAVRQAVDERTAQMAGGPGAGGPPAAAAMAGHPFLGGALSHLPEFVGLVERVILILQGQGQSIAP
jgi:pyruvate/2-oxoglutarate dehydrogenase complex dihydrolipoamide acyltransferase (E2) component